MTPTSPLAGILWVGIISHIRRLQEECHLLQNQYRFTAVWEQLSVSGLPRDHFSSARIHGYHKPSLSYPTHDRARHLLEEIAISFGLTQAHFALQSMRERNLDTSSRTF